MNVRRSAHKHGISSADGTEAATWPLVSVPLDDEDPRRFLRLGFDTHGRLLDVVRLVKPVLQQLRDETGETACLYVRDGAFRTIIAVAETRHLVMRPFMVGMVMPLHGGAPGKISGLRP